MRINKRTNLALRVLMYCAVNGGRNVTKAEIAQGCICSENHTGQVVNRLARLGLLITMRGRNGGLRLARAAEDISVGEIFRKLEADAPLAECFHAPSNTCPLLKVCRLREELFAAKEAFMARLDGVTLRSLVEDNAGLEALLMQPA